MAKKAQKKRRLPEWLPVPGWPYLITTAGEYRVRRLVGYDGRGRRIGGIELSPQKEGRAVSLRKTTPFGVVQRMRGVRALRAEAVECWANELDPAQPIADPELLPPEE